MARILIVDDSAFLIKQMKAFFEQHNHEVVATGSNGNMAIELYQKHKPDLTTLDLTMPNKSGHEALKEILALDSEAKIVIVSALKDKDNILSCIEDGASDFIEKPLKFKDPDFCENFISSINDALAE